MLSVARARAGHDAGARRARSEAAALAATCPDPGRLGGPARRRGAARRQPPRASRSPRARHPAPARHRPLPARDRRRALRLDEHRQDAREEHLLQARASAPARRPSAAPATSGSSVRRPAPRATSISRAAVISPMWLKACGKLPELLAVGGVDLLGQQAEVVGVARELVEQRLGALDLAGLREAGDQPERADDERALLAGQPVGVEALRRCGSAARGRPRSGRGRSPRSSSASAGRSPGRKP